MINNLGVFTVFRVVLNISISVSYFAFAKDSLQFLNDMLHLLVVATEN